MQATFTRGILAWNNNFALARHCRATTLGRTNRFQSRNLIGRHTLADSCNRRG
jgi:hypothetical protein